MLKEQVAVLIKQIYRFDQNQMDRRRQLTILDAEYCHQEALVLREHHKDYELWYDPIDKREYCEYKLYGWPNEKQLENYQFRKDQKSNLVYVHYLATLDNAGFKQFRVFVERIPLLLSSVNKLSFVQAMCIIKQSLIGFQALFKKFGYVHIDDKLIGFTPQGYIKVWMNETFAYNGVAQTHLAPRWMNQDLRARQMISSLFSIIEDRLEKNDKHRQFKRERQSKLTNLTFDNAIDFIIHYTRTLKIRVPKSLPQLLKWKISDAFRKRWIKNEQKITQPLMFKKMSSSSPTKKRLQNKISLTITMAKQNQKDKGAGTSRLLLGAGPRLLSPSASSAHGKLGIRPRNQSEAAISVAESRAKTCQTTIRFKKSTTKYFYEKNKDDFLNENGTLQSSLISRDYDMRSNNHFRFQPPKKLQQFQFTQITNQKSKPSHKKRKFSGADCVTFYANSAPQRQTNQNNLSLARSMVIKNKLESSNRFEKNPEIKLEGLESSKPFFDMEAQALVKKSNTTFGRAPSPGREPSPAREILQSHEVAYKNDKPFLNYKPIKSSFISNAKADLKDSTTQLEPINNLKNSFLKNVDMKSSEIIMERSSEYASIQDIMKTIKQSEIQTPISQANMQGFSGCQKQMSMFTGSPSKQRRGSQHNISSSTTDRKSSFYSEKKEGLLNFTSPKNTVKSGMFKSIFIEDARHGIKEVPEAQCQ